MTTIETIRRFFGLRPDRMPDPVLGALGVLVQCANTQIDAHTRLLETVKLMDQRITQLETDLANQQKGRFS